MASFTSILQSEPSVFLVGPTSKRLTIHAGLVKGLSEPFDKLMNDHSWKEANEEAPQLKYVDVETFIQFAEYCYTKNYRAIVEEVEEYESSVGSAEKCEEGPSEKTARVQVAQTTCDSWGGHSLFFKSQPPQILENQPRSKLWDEFMSRKFGSSYDLRTQLDDMGPRDEVGINIIQHAKLYVFADQYLLQPLKDLCLHKLHQDLLQYDIKEHGVEEIRDLLVYVYDNTSSANLGAGAGWDLRDLVMIFAACKAEMLVEDVAFRLMLENGTEVASAFATYMVKRL